MGLYEAHTSFDVVTQEDLEFVRVKILIGIRKYHSPSLVFCIQKLKGVSLLDHAINIAASLLLHCEHLHPLFDDVWLNGCLLVCRAQALLQLVLAAYCLAKRWYWTWPDVVARSPIASCVLSTDL